MYTSSIPTKMYDVTKTHFLFALVTFVVLFLSCRVLCGVVLVVCLCV